MVKDNPFCGSATKLRWCRDTVVFARMTEHGIVFTKVLTADEDGERGVDCEIGAEGRKVRRTFDDEGS